MPADEDADRPARTPEDAAERQVTTAAQAVEAVRSYLLAGSIRYPADELVAAEFDGGWTVFAPVHFSGDPSDLVLGRGVFLIGFHGQIEVSSSSVAPGTAEHAFTERHGTRAANSRRRPAARWDGAAP